MARNSIMNRVRAAGTFTALVVGVAAFSDSVFAAENWPQWRGPAGTGASADAKPPMEWSESKNIRWKVELPGSGTSSPVVWEDRIFIQAAVPVGRKEAAPAAAPSAPNAEPGRAGRGGRGRSSPPTEAFQFTLLCIDRATGKTIWSQVAAEETPHEGHHPDHGFASYSPVTDGKVVIVSFGSRGVHCFDLQGKPIWKKDLGKMQTRMSFGEGASPALFGDVVVINWDHEADDFIVALDKNTGKELWRQPRDEETTWATPLIVQHEGRAQVVTSAPKKIRAYDLKDGRLIWECGGLTSNVIPTPVAADGVVYAASGFRGSALLAIRLGREGDLTNTDAIVWKHNKSTPYVPSPLLYQGRLYFFGGNNAILSCFDVKTGKPLIDAQRVDDLEGVYASPVAAAGRVYLTGRNGAVVVIKAADKWEELAVNKLDDHFEASPAAVGSELFLRGRKHLYCIAEK